jgi:hypothetical protein
MGLTPCGYTCSCTRTCGTDRRLYSLLGSCGGTEQLGRLPTGNCCIPAPLFAFLPFSKHQRLSLSLRCRDPLRSGLDDLPGGPRYYLYFSTQSEVNLLACIRPSPHPTRLLTVQFCTCLVRALLVHCSMSFSM